MVRRLAVVKVIVKYLTGLVESNKDEIRLCLTDKVESLNERRSLYKELPSFLRNHETSQVDFLFTSDGKIIEICEIFNDNRYEVIKVADNFEDWVEDYNKTHTEAQIDIDYSKEKILEMNLGSYINDW